MHLKPPNLCDDSRLHVLLQGDEQSAEYRAVAAHVETCDVCQRRLTDLAGDAQSWSDVREYLASAPNESPQSAFAAPAAHARSQLDFLAPPSHPEMLGRLGRYEVERVIGSGGMGIVLRAFDTELHRPVAIKVLAPYLAHNGPARQRFAREGRAAAAVVHEHVVAIYNVEANGEVPFLVMQYVAGESLQDRVARQGPLGVKEILRIGIQAAAGLAAAHQQGLVHRDIKPANILLESSVERVLLTDFGLARAIDDASLTHTGLVAGTPHYMSPEQASGQPLDHRSDLFSLGAVLYFIATGHPPFRADRPMAVLNRICHERHRPVREVNPDIPKELARIIDRLLDKRLNRRPASATEVQLALAEVLAALQQGRTGRLRSGRSARRPRMVLLTALVAILALAAFALQQTARHAAVFRAAPTQPAVSRAVESQSAEHQPAVVLRLDALGPSPPLAFAEEFVQLNTHVEQFEAWSGTSGLVPIGPIDAWQQEVDLAAQQLQRLENSPP